MAEIGAPLRRGKRNVLENLDGSHPWKSVSPEGYVEYEVRQLPKCEIRYFNFALAKEMGIIPPNVNTINAQLKASLLNSFAIRIINEYDIKHKTYAGTKKPGSYMATRYLQSQHRNRQGKTSGDGRSIWNGIIEYNNRLWDISSRGTGVTCLSPGFAEAGKPLRTGNTKHGYGCGLADLDEMISCAIQSEILYDAGIHTERTLLVLEDADGNGIGVRAGENLLRPAHLFRYLKLNKLENLKKSLQYFIQRQNPDVNTVKDQHYKQFIEDFKNKLARFVAQLEEDYIFVWLDWDGDNMLLDPGIIDYGSVRQFGSLHDQYRYDDITRFSTSLPEQKEKARRILISMLQAVDYVITGFKSPLLNFSRHSLVQNFDEKVLVERKIRFLFQLGFEESEAQTLYQKHAGLVNELFDMYHSLGRIKSRKKIESVADGIDRPPLFTMRQFIRNWISHSEYSLSTRVLHSVRAVQLRPKAERFIPDFEKLEKLLHQALHKGTKDIQEFKSRCLARNSDGRITGNAVIHITNHILKNKANSQNLIDWVVAFAGSKSSSPMVDAKLIEPIVHIIEQNSKEL